MKPLLRLILGLAVASAPSSYVSAQAQRSMASTPVGPGSPARRAILDAIRPAVERQLGPEVAFMVTEIRVVRGWAFVAVTPQRRGGRPINGYDYFPDFENMGGLEVQAVLRLRNGHWAVVQQAMGATDVWYCDMGPPGLTPSCTMN